MVSWERMEYLRIRIQDRQILKEAQVRDGADYRFFQNEVTELTYELRAWEQVIDTLDDLADRISAVNNRIRAAQEDAVRAAGSWGRLASVCGLVGALLFALGLRWSLNLLLEVGAVLLVLAGVAVLMVTRVRTSAREEVARARLQLAQLQAERDVLIPPSYPPVNPFPRFSQEVVVRYMGSPSR